MDVPDWLWHGLVLWAVGKAIDWMWKHRSKVADWYHIPQLQLVPWSEPVKSASITARLVGVTRVKQDGTIERTDF